MKIRTQMILSKDEMQNFVLSYIQMMGEIDKGLHGDDKPTFSSMELLQLAEKLFSGNTDFATVTQTGDEFTFVQEVDIIDPRAVFESMGITARSIGQMIAKEEGT